MLSTDTSVHDMSKLFFFFFLIHQFITRGAKTDHGRYKTYLNNRDRREEERKEETDGNIWETLFVRQSKEKAFGFSLRNVSMLTMERSGGRHVSLYFLHSYRMRSLVSMTFALQLHRDSSWGKNLFLYSPMGAWLVMRQVSLAHRELEWPM